MLTIYHTGKTLHGQSNKSYEICRRIALATDLPLYHVNDFEIGTTPIVYGAMRGTAEVMQKALWSGTGYWYVDNGYIGARHYDGYYRVCRNKQFDAFIDWRKLAFDPKPNANIVVVKPSFQGCTFLPFHKVDPEAWTDGVLWALKNKGYKNIVVSAKTGNFPRIEELYYDALVAHNSATLYTSRPAANVTTLYTNVDWQYYNIDEAKKHQFLLDELTQEHFA